MISNHLKTAFRYIIKNRINNLIIIAGMALGLSTCIILFLFLQFELNWNKSHYNVDNIYRVLLKRTPEGKDPWFGKSGCPLLTSEVTDKLAEVEASSRIWTPSLRVSFDEYSNFENCIFAEENFFNLFDYKFIKGSLNSFNNLSTVLINDEIAKKYFGKSDPVNQLLTIEIEGENRLFTVGGVYKTQEKNNTLSPELILPFEVIYEKMRQRYGDHWGVTFCLTFLQLKDGVDPLLVEKTIAQRLEALDVQMESVNGKHDYQLQPYNEIHASFSNPRGFPTESNANGLLVLMAIAVIILMICCINFATLSIGSSTGRIRETGVRKVLGASRYSLMSQHWLETAIITTFSFILALLLADMFLPLMENIIDFDSEIRFTLEQTFLLISLWIFVVLISGTYPALVISAFPLVNAFKGEAKLGEQKKFKRALLLTQFTLSIALVAGSLIMTQQMLYLQNKDLGFKPDQSIIIPVRGSNGDANRVISLLRDEYNGSSEVNTVAGSSCYFGYRWTKFDWYFEGEKYSGFNQCTVDLYFLKCLEIEIVEGRDFSWDIVSDSRRAVIVNEAFLRRMNWESAVGKQLPGDFDDHEIIGVTRDFNYNSLHQEVKPLILTMNPEFMTSCSSYNYFSQTGMNISNVIIKISMESRKKTLEELKNFWDDNVNSEFPFNFKFIDDQIQRHYETELVWVKIVSISSMVAVIIAIMGVLGLTLIQVHGRIKEFGIRKVLGASLLNIMSLTIKEISLIVIISNLLAWPLAWLMMTRWLEGFAYNVSISPATIMGSGLLVLAIAWMTVGLVTYKAATANPVESLRVE